MARSSTHRDLNTWLDSHGYHHSRKPKAPVLSYTNWTTQLGDAGRVHEVSVAYGPETHDAWKSGMSPDAYARSLQGLLSQRQQKNGRAREPKEGLILVDISWFAVPNDNRQAGGWLPGYQIDGGHVHGDTWAARGHSKAEAEQLARAKADKEATKYVGDWNVTVRKGRPIAKSKHGHTVKQGCQHSHARKQKTAGPYAAPPGNYSAVTLTKGGRTVRFETTRGDRVTLKNSSGEVGRITREEALQRISKLVAAGWSYEEG